MRVDNAPLSLKRVVLATLLAASIAADANAQAPGASSGALEALVIPGTTVWVTDVHDRREKARVVDARGDILTIATGSGMRRIPAGEVRRIDVRQSDSLIDGALIGAGAAIASGLFLCTRTEPWANCRDDAGPIARIGAIGAGIGIAVDALIRTQRTIYESVRPSTRLHVAPVIDNRARGVRIALMF